MRVMMRRTAMSSSQPAAVGRATVKRSRSGGAGCNALVTCNDADELQMACKREKHILKCLIVDRRPLRWHLCKANYQHLLLMSTGRMRVEYTQPEITRAAHGRHPCTGRIEKLPST